jgi:hypothetical protein
MRRRQYPAEDTGRIWCTGGARMPAPAVEHTFGEQFGEQIESNWDVLRHNKPSKHGPHQLSSTPSLRLGAGRSLVRIQSPRLRKSWKRAGFITVRLGRRNPLRVQFRRGSASPLQEPRRLDVSLQRSQRQHSPWHCWIGDDPVASCGAPKPSARTPAGDRVARVSHLNRDGTRPDWETGPVIGPLR